MMVAKKKKVQQKKGSLFWSLKNYLWAVCVFIFWGLVKIGDGALALGKFLFQFLKAFLRSSFGLFSFLEKILSKTWFWAKKRPRLPKKKLKVIFPPPGFLKLRWFLAGFCAAVFLLLIPSILFFWLHELPSPYALKNRQIPQTTKIYDRGGRLLYQIYASQDRTLIPLSEIPENLKKATIAIEDKDFYKHQGFSLWAIARAIRENLIHHKLQGGSTITQQLVKSALLTPEPTLSRKIKEIFLAFWAERIYTKDQILEMYLNQVPYGGTAWGVEAASQTYFGKSVKDLTLAEAALLAGLPAAPTLYSPFGAHPQLSKERQKEVLKRMVEEGYLGKSQAEEAQSQDLTFAPQKTNIRAPHFVMYVKEKLVEKYGHYLVEQGGLRVTTSLDLDLQEMAQEIVFTEIKNLESLWVTNGAALITNPKTGEILAMVGSRDYFDISRQGNVNVTLAPRQPGSSIKVVTYAAALQNGFTAATILDDSPVTYQTPGSPPYSPVNYDSRFHGKLPLRFAFGNSYNVPAVKTLAQIGVKTMLEQGKKMGITTWEDERRFGLSLTLGGGEVTMLDMATAYGVLANLGKKVQPNPILEVRDFKGEILEIAKARQEEVLPAGVAFILSDILADNQTRSAAFGPSSSLVIPGKTVSVKTGTTNDKRDNWTIGFTLSILAAVWVGNNNNAPMHPTLTSGITGAAPIWNKIMGNLLKDKPNEGFPKPGDVVEAEVCPLWGRAKEYFLTGTQPKGIFCPQISPTPQPTP